MKSDSTDRLLAGRIRAGHQDAWAECIARFEGRLLAFVDGRLRDRAASEDVVQETFLGFLVALPNYSEDTPLESFLFAIAAHKLTDLLRKQGRRPALPLFSGVDSERSPEPRANVRMASSLARSRERRGLEERVVQQALVGLIDQWQREKHFERLKCIELLWVRGWQNKDVAQRLGISEQAVANHKHFVIGKLKEFVSRSSLQDVDVTALGLE